MLLSGGFITAIVFFVIAAALITLSIVGYKRDWFEYEKEVPYVGFIAGVAVLIIVALALIPWPMRYHVWEPHSGQISRIEERLVTDGSDSANITKEMGFWLEGEDEAYYTNDLRFQALDEGDTVTLRRKDNKQWGGTNYWDTKLIFGAAVGR